MVPSCGCCGSRTAPSWAQNPEAPDHQIQRGFYREEQRLGADFEKHAKMTKRDIRQVMAMPDAPEADY